MAQTREDQDRQNSRETGAQKMQPSRDNEGLPDFPHTGDSGDEPREPYGLTEGSNDRGGRTRHYDGVDQPRGPNDLATQREAEEAVPRKQQ